MFDSSQEDKKKLLQRPASLEITRAYLTEYWVDGEELHYITTYGGEGSVLIQRIDFEATAKINLDRGVEFVLKPKPVAQSR